jgi:hypothetical protein
LGATGGLSASASPLGDRHHLCHGSVSSRVPHPGAQLGVRDVDRDTLPAYHCSARPSVPAPYRASAPIGSHGGSTIGGCSSAACSSAGSALRRAAISNMYSSNHASCIT